ncbi:MAG: crotonase/enoyl-CoA hydratase family protein [Actinomycetota bacterium]
MSVRRERRGRIEIVTLDRPEARNAIDGDTAWTLSAIFDELESDDEVWAVVITGAGKAFCAGVDLKAIATEAERIIGAPGGFAGIAQRFFPKPLIAAVNGPALAGGFEIVLSCDLAVAAEHATFGIPEVKRGLMAAAGGLIRLGKRIPLALALEFAMTGDPVDAQRALALGLVNRVVPAEAVLDEAIALAERICENAPVAVRLSKRLMIDSLELNEEEAWKRNFALAGEVTQTKDVWEGIAAFAEKRPPVWQGR